MKALKNNSDNIPLIVVFPHAINKEEIDKTKIKIMSLFPDLKFIHVLGRRVDDIEQFNLDELLKLTIDTVKSNIKNEIFYEICNKYNEKEKVNIINKISEIIENINNEIINEFINNYNLVLSKDNFDEFTNYLIQKVFTEFSLEKRISKNTKLLIENGRNIMKKHIQSTIQLYTETSQKYINMIIEKKSVEYLDMQVKIEKVKNSSIMFKYKRTREGFKNIITKFLQDNFYYISQKYCIFHFIKVVLETLIMKFADALSLNISKFLQSNEMHKNYINVYLKIFEEYEKDINNKREYNGNIYN